MLLLRLLEKLRSYSALVVDLDMLVLKAHGTRSKLIWVVQAASRLGIAIMTADDIHPMRDIQAIVQDINILHSAQFTHLAIVTTYAIAKPKYPSLACSVLYYSSYTVGHKVTCRSLLTFSPKTKAYKTMSMAEITQKLRA